MVDATEDGAAFADGPAPGDRAPDAQGMVRAGTGYPQRLFTLLRGPEPVLLLRVDAAGLDEAAGLVARLRAAVPDLRAYAVTAEPMASPPGLPVVHDSEGAFVGSYGGAAGAVWLVRPDGHLGYRADRLRRDGLLDYLRRSFTRSGPA